MELILWINLSEPNVWQFHMIFIAWD